MNTKTDTLIGGRNLTIKSHDGTPREVMVRQLRVGEYQKAFPKIDNEIALCAFVAGLTDAEVGEIDPVDYEKLFAAVQEVNAQGFFVWSARQLKRAQEQLAGLTPEIIKLAMERGASLSQTPSPASVPRRA